MSGWGNREREGFILFQSPKADSTILKKGCDKGSVGFLQHAYLGTGIMALFLVHAALGLKLGLSI